MTYSETIKHKAEEVKRCLEYVSVINNQRGFTDKDLFNFFSFTSEGRIFPDFIDALASRMLTKFFCSATKSFWTVRNSLPSDVQQEFLTHDFTFHKAIIESSPDIRAELKGLLGDEIIGG